MKKQELAIKYSHWTVAFFWTFIILFVFITVGGMVYSYTNLIQLAFKLSYSDNELKANFWPIFTELTMVCLSVLLLVIRFNKWPKLALFKSLFYTFALIVILANAYNTSVTSGFNLNSMVDLAIQELPVICYLVFLEIALYVTTNVISDKIKVGLDKPPLTMIDENLDKPIEYVDSKPIKFIERPEINKADKEINKQKFLDILKDDPGISQNKACEQLGVSGATGTNYVKELKQSNQLDRIDDKWVVYEW